MIKHIRDFGLLRGAALAAATIISFEAEAQLASLIGVGETVSYAMPIAIDCLMIAALRSRHFWAITCASLLMGGANAASHLLTDDTGAVSQGIIAAVSVVPVVVLMLLELLVPAVRETITAEVAAPVTQPAVSHDVARYAAETIPVISETPMTQIAASHETPADVSPIEDGTPPEVDETVTMSRDTAMKIAEDAYAMPGTKTIKQVARETGRSVPTINRWYAGFREAGVKQLITQTA